MGTGKRWEQYGEDMLINSYTISARFIFFLSLSAVTIFCFPDRTWALQFSLEPAEARLGLGETAILKFSVDTEGQNVNLIDARLAFDPERLKILDVSRGASVFPFWLKEPVPDREIGLLRLVAGISHPGFTGNDGFVANITVQSLHQGLTALEVLEESGAYLNDGQGAPVPLVAKDFSLIRTEVPTPSLPLLEGEREEEGAITPLPLLPEEELGVVREEEKALGILGPPSTPIIYSSSHPDSVRWYAKRQVDLDWHDEAGADYSFVFDQAIDTIPDTFVETKENRTRIKADSDGIWYFHLRAGRAGFWSEATHFRVQIDTVRPKPFEILVIPPSPIFDHQYVLAFFTTDVTSGVDHWEISEPQGTARVSGNYYVLMRQDPGLFYVRVTAVDQAGNRQITEKHLYIPYPPGLLLRWALSSIVLVLAMVYVYSLAIYLLKRFRLI